jgi:preprotein translocase subunit SecY
MLAHLWTLAGWRRLAVTGLCLVVWRAMEQIAVPGLNPAFITVLQGSPSTPLQAFGASIPLASNSIGTMGIGPYVNALVIMTLARMISSSVRAIERTPEGRPSLRLWTRALAIVLALGQAYGYTVLMQNTVPPALPEMDWSARLAVMVAMTGGTVVLIFLADVLDEHGLGFGNGAFLIYALSPLAIEVHRLAATLATAPSVDAMYLPLFLWLVFSVGIASFTVAVLLAVRRIPTSEGEGSKPVELRLLMSGVIRPPIFTFALLFLPAIVGNYYAAANPDISRWVSDYLTAYGANPWTSAAYTAFEALLVIAFTYFVVQIDFGSATRELTAHIRRLTLAGGTFLAITVIVLPVLEWKATHAAGRVIAMSGFDAVLLVALILAAVVSLEQSAKGATYTPVLVSPVP